MPIYNGEQYIRESIPRALNGSKKEVELILVNDGSTDNSLAICNKFATKYKNIKVVNMSNGGICSARNEGLKIAKGEFIAFADQDDCIEYGSYDYLIDAILEDQSDLAVGSKKMKLISNDGRTIKSTLYQYRKETISDEKKIISYLLNEDRNLMLIHLWNCIYKKELIVQNNLEFDITFKFGQEDTLFNIQYCLNCNKISVVPNLIYTYFRRERSSTSLKKEAGSFEDYKYFMNKVKYLFNEKYNQIYDSNIYIYGLRYAIGVYNKNFSKDKETNVLLWKNLYKVNLYNNSGKWGGNKIVSHYFLAIYIIHFLSKMKKYKLCSDFINLISRK